MGNAPSDVNDATDPSLERDADTALHNAQPTAPSASTSASPRIIPTQPLAATPTQHITTAADDDGYVVFGRASALETVRERNSPAARIALHCSEEVRFFHAPWGFQ